MLVQIHVQCLEIGQLAVKGSEHAAQPGNVGHPII
jgi:hypothetical protein